MTVGYIPPAAILTAIVGALALANTIYFRVISKRSSQLELTDKLLEAKSDFAMVVYGPMHAPVFNRKKGAFRKLVRSAHLRDETEAGRVIEEALLVRGDLILRDECTFLDSLKVSGNLIVHGRVLFKGPVVVDGSVHITGGATFNAGLLTRSTFRVTGRAIQYRWLNAKYINARVHPHHDLHLGEGAL